MPRASHDQAAACGCRSRTLRTYGFVLLHAIGSDSPDRSVWISLRRRRPADRKSKPRAVRPVGSDPPDWSARISRSWRRRIDCMCDHVTAWRIVIASRDSPKLFRGGLFEGSVVVQLLPSIGPRLSATCIHGIVWSRRSSDTPAGFGPRVRARWSHFSLPPVDYMAIVIRYRSTILPGTRPVFGVVPIGDDASFTDAPRPRGLSDLAT